MWRSPALTRCPPARPQPARHGRTAASLQDPTASLRAVGREVLPQAMRRMAVMPPMEATDTTCTGSLEVEACTIWPLPMYIDTWLTGL